MKAWLSRAGVDVVAHNVEQDDRAYDALLALGYRTVPVTVIADRVIKGFAPEALDAAISAARRPSDPGAP